MALRVRDLETKPTLESICLNKIACSLLLAKVIVPFVDRDSDWSIVEPYLFSQVRHANLPERLKKKIYQRLKPIFEELLYFSRGQRFGLEQYGCRWRKLRVLECVSLNPNGQIEWSYLAKKIVENPIHFGLSFKDAFEIGCLFCLENELRTFWNRGEIDLKLSSNDPMPVRYWFHRLRGRLDLLEAELIKKYPRDRVQPIYFHLFEYAYNFGTRRAMDYAYVRLTGDFGPKKLRVNFWRASTNWYWLISMISVEEMVERLAQNPVQILTKVALDCPWPFWPIFEELTRRVWDLELSGFTLENHVSLLKGLVSDYSGLTSRFLVFAWYEAPDIYRDYALQNSALVRRINKRLNWDSDRQKLNLSKAYCYWGVTLTDIFLGATIVISVSFTSISPIGVICLCPFWLLSSWLIKVRLL